MPPLPKVYTAIKTVGAYTIARRHTDKLFYIFNEEGGINKEVAFTNVERAETYIPTIDHMVKFTATLAGNQHRPSWRKR